MNNEQTIVIKLDAKEIIEELVKLREEVEQFRKRIERFDCEGMPEIRQ